MKNIVLTFLTGLTGIVICAAVWAQTARPREAGADWPMYNRDYAGTRYSPLAQIKTANVANLTKAWSYKIAAGRQNDHGTEPQ
jgi:glucose dehydrogenase